RLRETRMTCCVSGHHTRHQAVAHRGDTQNGALSLGYWGLVCVEASDLGVWAVVVDKACGHIRRFEGSGFRSGLVYPVPGYHGWSTFAPFHSSILGGVLEVSVGPSRSMPRLLCTTFFRPSVI
ncbi:hypothetical protein M8C21_030812, partial [Ambrosia artemisiifolia]